MKFLISLFIISRLIPFYEQSCLQMEIFLKLGNFHYDLQHFSSLKSSYIWVSTFFERFSQHWSVVYDTVPLTIKLIHRPQTVLSITSSWKQKIGKHDWKTILKHDFHKLDFLWSSFTKDKIRPQFRSHLGWRAFRCYQCNSFAQFKVR